jgi:osmoprotectant transport system permease protein
MNKDAGSKSARAWLAPVVYLGLFLAWVLFFEAALPLFSQWLPKRAVALQRTPLWHVALQHLFITALSTGAAVFTSLCLAVGVRLSRSEALKSLVLTISSVSETIPSAAVIALSVPALGYGNNPVLLALYLYAILPVVRNAVVGMEAVPRSVRESGEGMGMTRMQQLTQVDLPLARPVIFAGIRTALVINISAATIGATVGAGGFGVPIIAGIRIFDPILVLSGSVPVVLLALFADRLFRAGPR